MKSKLIYNYVPCKIVFEGSKVMLPQRVQNEIKNNWDNLIDSGKKFLNNELFTVDSIETKESEIIFNTKKTHYDHYLHSASKSFVGKYMCRSIASNVLISTADGYYVLAIMSSETALPDRIKFIGGSLSEEDLNNSILDPYQCIKRETYEEIGLKLEDNITMYPKYFITRANLAFINTLYMAELEMSREDVKNLFDDYKKTSKNEQFELKDILFVKKDVSEMRSFIEKNRSSFIDYMEEFFYVLIGELEAQNIYDEIKKLS